MLHRTVRRVLITVTSLAATFLLAGAADASAQAFLPPGNKVFAGVSLEPVPA